jgi:hypothetical protein
MSMFPVRRNAANRRRMPGRFPSRAWSVETLDVRALPTVSISLTAGVLSIVGDSLRNAASVSLTNGTTTSVVVSSTPAVGTATPVVVTKSYPSADVKLVKFYGNDAADSYFARYYLPLQAWGGNGNDTLSGSNAADRLYGGDGDDRIWGYGGNDYLEGDAGNDNLYGGAANDTLYGNAGTDGLFGGPGANSSYGGADADRFLMYYGSSDAKDAVSTDAVVRFRNAAKNWTDAEIEAVDIGLRLLHQRTQNDNLLENKAGGSLVYLRQAADGDTFAANTNSVQIEFYDLAFESKVETVLTTIHENGHNWDEQHAAWPQWLALSGWRNTAPPAATASLYNQGYDGGWWYLKSATFTSDYSLSSPYEDLATSWETYFRTRYPQVITSNPDGYTPLSAAKQSHLEAFFQSQV